LDSGLDSGLDSPLGAELDSELDRWLGAEPEAQRSRASFPFISDLEPEPTAPDALPVATKVP